MDATLYIPYKAGPKCVEAISDYGKSRLEFAKHAQALLKYYGSNVADVLTDVFQSKFVALKMKGRRAQLPAGFIRSDELSNRFGGIIVVPNPKSKDYQLAVDKLESYIAPVFHNMIGGKEIQAHPQTGGPFLAGYTHAAEFTWVLIPRDTSNPTEPVFQPVDGERATLGQFYDDFEKLIVADLVALRDQIAQQGANQ